MYRLVLLARPYGLALGLSIALNTALAIESPSSSATRVWLHLPLDEPLLSFIAAGLGLALFVPHSAGRRPWVRWWVGGILLGFAFLAASNVVTYYHRLHQGLFSTTLPVPFSLLIVGILIAESIRMSCWRPRPVSRMPPPARFLVRAIVLTLAFFFLTAVHVVTFGSTDYRRPARAAVVLGAKVHDDGTLSPSLRHRVDTGVELYREGLVEFLIMSGGTGPNGRSEPESMADHAEREGVPRDRILIDPEGTNTRFSALNCRAIAKERRFDALLAVSHDYHCARIKLIFEREGMPCFTVPAGRKSGKVPPFWPKFYLFREILAYPFYFVYHN
jgi:vancomycin permeability regulator SanA